MKPGDRLFVKSPFDNVLNLLNVIPQGHEKALKHALYNAVATLLLFICTIAAWGLFYILEPFVKPLIWALLVGSVLHPMKRSLENKFENGLNHFEKSSSPLLLSAVLLPIRVLDDISEAVGSTIRKYWEVLCGICVAVLLIFLAHSYLPNVFLSLFFCLWNFNCEILQWMLNNITPTMFVTFVVVYFATLSIFWSQENKLYLTLSTYAGWIIVALFIARSIGILTIPLFISLLFCLSLGFFYEVKETRGSHESWLEAILSSFQCGTGQSNEQGTASEEVKESVKTAADTEEDQPKLGLEAGATLKPSMRAKQLTISGIPRKSDPEVYFRRSQSGGSNLEESEQLNVAEESWKYLYAVFWACGFVLLWKNIWLAHLLPIPIVFFLIKKIGHYFGIWCVIGVQCHRIQVKILDWLTTRACVLFPPPIRGLFKLGCAARAYFLIVLRDSISSFSSTLVILGLILFLFCFTTFIILKIYAEGIHLVAFGASVINSTVVHNPEFLQLLPEGWGDKMESVLNNAYIYGREGISKQLRSILKDVESVKASELERQVLELWDRVYQAWLMGAVETSSIGPKVPTSAVYSSWYNFMETLNKTPGILNMSTVTEFLKDNVETLMSLLDSVWALLKGNVGLVFQFLFAAVSLLLGGGSAVLNFVVSAIVFFTALFYLLSSSRDLYKPVDLLSNFSPVNGAKVGVAFEAAVNGVFKASFKMALFYGLWTWLVHNLFQVRIIYLPSVLAAMLGAVPFLGTYWASVPAVLELWLAQQQGVLAIALFVCQCLPMSFVDTAIYQEIRGGGHPYMTGLAIAGGVFCMGIQGAILGPLLLCCLLVALNMSTSLMKESPSEPNLSAFRQLRRDDQRDVPFELESSNT